MTDNVLQARGLVKSYGKRRVVDSLDLTCRAGSILGLLGPNGAGKTTTLRMLYGYIEPDDGTIQFGGRDFRAHRLELKRTIGVCTQEDTLDYDFSVRENLAIHATYFRPRPVDVARRIETLLDEFGLEEYAETSPHALSGGFKRRLMIARSVVHSPRVLFLDEPTTGLDPSARVALWELVNGMRAQGMSIVLTTHYMDEAERLSDDLLVMAKGRSVAQGPPRQVLGHLVGDHVLVIPADEPDQKRIRAWLEQQTGDKPSSVLGQLSLAVSAPLLGRFTAEFPSARFTVRPPNLDDLFLLLSVAADSGDEP